MLSKSVKVTLSIVGMKLEKIMGDTMQSMQWLHISDIHMGKDELGQEQMIKGLIKYIKREQFRPDLIFITGDIADNGKESQYQQFLKVFFSPLLNEMLSIHGDEGRKRIFVIPGNHDVNRDEAVMAWKGMKQDIIENGPKALALEPRFEGLMKRREIIPRFQNYANASYLHEAIEVGGSWISSTEGAYTCWLDFPGFRIGILGLNTAWVAGSNSHNADKEYLSPGQFIIRKGLGYLHEQEKCDVLFVLGHHSIDWFHNVGEERETIRALFGEHHVIYLNGDLHESRVKREYGAEQSFLVMQTGAAFQERQHDLWVNRLLRCELDFANKNIRVRPLQWSRTDERWVPDFLPGSDDRRRDSYYSFPLPGSVEEQRDISSPIANNTVLSTFSNEWENWTFLKRENLKEIQASGELTKEQVLRYFDGVNPTWKYALSSQIPRRTKVEELRKILSEVRKEDQPYVIVLLGGGGEGKSTILQQVVCDLLQDNESYWNIIWHKKRESSLSEKSVRNLPSDSGAWLIVSDDAESIVQKVYETALMLSESERKCVHFLLSCRDTDWRNAKGDLYAWNSSGVKCQKIFIEGLTLTDARRIVEKWRFYDIEGMRDLYGLTDEVAANKLYKMAVEEAVRKDLGGSFLGAMIRVRYSRSMQEHVLTLLNRLNRPTPIVGSNGRPLNLLFAYAHIAALHAVNFTGLTDEILANALKCSIDDLNEDIVGPLGLEAAISTEPSGESVALISGECILTRHRAIAEEAVKLFDRFNFKLENIVANLLLSAIKTLQKHELTPWRSLPSQFAKEKKHNVAIKLGNIWVKEEPHDVLHVNYLARFYRDNNQPAYAVKVFRDAFEKLSIELKDKLYYHEWATAQAEAKYLYTSIWLNGVALADGGPPNPKRNDKYTEADLAKICLNGLSIVFGRIFRETESAIFGRAWVAATSLGLTLQGSDLTSGTDFKLKQNQNEITSNKKIEIIKLFDPQNALSILKEAITEAWLRREEQLPIKGGDALRFTHVATLFQEEDIS